MQVIFYIVKLLFVDANDTRKGFTYFSFWSFSDKIVSLLSRIDGVPWTYWVCMATNVPWEKQTSERSTNLNNELLCRAKIQSRWVKWKVTLGKVTQVVSIGKRRLLHSDESERSSDRNPVENKFYRMVVLLFEKLASLLACILRITKCGSYSTEATDVTLIS